MPTALAAKAYDAALADLAAATAVQLALVSRAVRETPMASATSIIDPRVTAEIKRYGSLELAIAGLTIDACGAEWDAPIHAILREALRLQSERAKAPVLCGPRSAARYCFQAMGAA